MFLELDFRIKFIIKLVKKFISEKLIFILLDPTNYIYENSYFHETIDK